MRGLKPRMTAVGEHTPVEQQAEPALPSSSPGLSRGSTHPGAHAPSGRHDGSMRGMTPRMTAVKEHTPVEQQAEPALPSSSPGLSRGSTHPGAHTPSGRHDGSRRGRTPRMTAVGEHTPVEEQAEPALPASCPGLSRGSTHPGAHAPSGRHDGSMRGMTPRMTAVGEHTPVEEQAEPALPSSSPGLSRGSTHPGAHAPSGRHDGSMRGMTPRMTAVKEHTRGGRADGARPPSVIPGLVPGIDPSGRPDAVGAPRRVDARHDAAHDEAR